LKKRETPVKRRDFCERRSLAFPPTLRACWGWAQLYPLLFNEKRAERTEGESRIRLLKGVRAESGRKNSSFSAYKERKGKEPTRLVCESKANLTNPSENGGNQRGGRRLRRLRHFENGAGPTSPNTNRRKKGDTYFCVRTNQLRGRRLREKQKKA